MITNIKIKNIKGYSSHGCNIDVQLKPNKLNILLAPNGFGKTSLATAFSSLKPRKLDVKDDDKFLKNTDLSSSLSITLDNKELTADNSHNDINKIIYPYVIKSKLVPGASSKTFGGHTSTKSFFNIEDIEVVDVSPSCSPKYKIRNVQKHFGKNGKILSNLESQLSNLEFLQMIINCFDCFEKFKAKIRTSLILEVVNKINVLKGNANEIVQQCNTDTMLFADLESEPFYKKAILELDPESENSPIDNFLLFYQLLDYYKADSRNIQDNYNRLKYVAIKKNIEETLASLNSTWKNIKVTETNKKLLVSYPHANEISNGQRDILTFVVQLISFLAICPNNKKSLVIIDEVFDYLDDANMIAAQYFLTKFLKNKKTDIYVVILTHLDPKYFRSYVFNKYLNINTLVNNQPVGSPQMKAFISFRENLNKENETTKILYHKLSHYFFHYTTDTIDVSSEIPQKEHLSPLWAKDLNLHSYIAEECTKYLSEEDSYDPYAICIGIRMKLEKFAYNNIASPDDKDIFIQTKETNKKMDFAKSKGVDIPDSYYLLSPIHNDADHLRDENSDKMCIYKLQHPVIRNLVKNVFEEKTVITVNDIH